MLAKATNPLIRTTIDLRLNRPDRPLGDRLFEGWGAGLPGNRTLS